MPIDTIYVVAAAVLLFVNSACILLLFIIAMRLSRNAEDQRIELKSSLLLLRSNIVSIDIDLHRNYKEFLDCHTRILERLELNRK